MGFPTNLETIRCPGTTICPGCRQWFQDTLLTEPYKTTLYDTFSGVPQSLELQPGHERICLTREPGAAPLSICEAAPENGQPDTPYEILFMTDPDPKLRRHGLATTVVNAMVSFLRGKNVGTVHLNIDAANHRSSGLARKLGAKRADTGYGSGLHQWTINLRD